MFDFNADDKLVELLSAVENQPAKLFSDMSSVCKPEEASRRVRIIILANDGCILASLNDSNLHMTENLIDQQRWLETCFHLCEMI